MSSLQPHPPLPHGVGHLDILPGHASLHVKASSLQNESGLIDVRGWEV